VSRRRETVVYLTTFTTSFLIAVAAIALLPTRSPGWLFGVALLAGSDLALLLAVADDRRRRPHGGLG
jgi:hypothetical protein